MKRLDSLTPEQEALMPVIAKKWIDRAISGEFDETGATEGIRWLYNDLLKKPMPMVFFVDCPYTAMTLISLLKNSSVRASVWASVRDSVWASVRDSVRASVWASVWASVRDSVRDSVGDSVWASVRDSVRASVRASVWASVRDSVWASVRDSVRASVWASVWASVRDSVRDSVWGSQYEDIWLQKSRYCEYSDAHFCAWADFYESMSLECVSEHKNFARFKKFIWSNPFMSWFYDDVAVVVRPPTTITKDAEGRLHDSANAAIRFTNGVPLYFIRGRAMPAKIFEEPITMQQFMSEKNEDTRAGMYEVLEAKNGFAEMSGAEIVSEETVVHDGGYMETIHLYKTKERFVGTTDALTGETNVQLAWLKLTCPSTGQQYMIPSFPSFNTATEAARYHRPEGIPFGMEYRWNSAN